MNERDFPHVVEIELPPGGFRNKSLEFESFHRERSIVIRRGCGRHEVEQFHVRFCFPDAATADAFQERFGGTRPTYSPSKPGRHSGPRVRYQRSYSPRVSCLPEGCSRACVSDFKTAGVAVGSRQLCLNPIDISAAGVCRSVNVDKVRSGATKLDEQVN